MAPRVIYEDADFVAVDKPAGVLTHASRISADTKRIGADITLVDWLLKRYPEIKDVGDEPETRPGIVHRLDRDTSGVIVAARNQKAFDYLKGLFQKHEVKKTYLALARGKVKERAGVIDKPIALKSGTIKRTVHNRGVKLIKEAVTKYKILKFLEFQGQEFTLLEVQPLTGRTHQIRVHLNSIGHPILGDAVYGRKEERGKRGEEREKGKELALKRLFLHAESIEFTKSDGGRIKISADLPPDLKQALSLLSPGPRDFHLHN